ncbi:MAG: cytochrome-c peroxidase, partial [Myxococcales bacterium]|nr:cytochrome-c peroxidase [Myxococcales bacterium]
VAPYETEDLGRFEVTSNEADKYAFKVPSLRNVAKTAPYLHDGSVASLDEMVRIMGTHQLGRELTDQQVTDIREFLGALSGTPDSDYIAAPPMPESGPDTPKPDAS